MIRLTTSRAEPIESASCSCVTWQTTLLWAGMNGLVGAFFGVEATRIDDRNLKSHKLRPVRLKRT